MLILHRIQDDTLVRNNLLLVSTSSCHFECEQECHCNLCVSEYSNDLEDMMKNTKEDCNDMTPLFDKKGGV